MGKRDRMMRSKSFETQEVREISRKEAGKSRGFLSLRMGIIQDIFQLEGKIENVKMKIHARARNVLYHGIGDFVRASGSRPGEVCGSHKKFSLGEGGAEAQVNCIFIAV